MSDAPHLLVVDDTRDVRDALRQYLVKHGYRVTVAESAAAARRELQMGAIDLVILDIMMPGEDGLSLCRELRAKGAVPIIMLTALGEETDRIIGLEMGADDYVTKPFAPRELLARIKAVRRRAQSLPHRSGSGSGSGAGPAAGRLRFDRWRFDPAARELLDEAGTVVPLSTGEFLLLDALLLHPGLVLSRDQLLDLTRGREAVPFDRSVDNQVSRLRKKLERDPKNPTLIKTHWGGGYSFAGKVEPE